MFHPGWMTPLILHLAGAVERGAASAAATEVTMLHTINRLVATRPRTSRSRCWYGRLAYTNGTTVIVVFGASRSVYPSPFALATASAPSMVPAPGLLSTITGCPSLTVSTCANCRPTAAWRAWAAASGPSCAPSGAPTTRGPVWRREARLSRSKGSGNEALAFVCEKFKRAEDNGIAPSYQRLLGAQAAHVDPRLGPHGRPRPCPPPYA